MDLGELRQMLTDWASRIVRFTQIASAKSDGSASVVGRSIPGGPDAPSIKARLMFPFGLRSVPPSGVDAAVVHAAGASARGMIVGCDSKEYGPSDLDWGETAVYSQQNPKALLADKSGNTKITSTTVDGTPGDVVVNGGTKPVGRKDDPVSHGTLVVTAVMAAGVPIVTIVYTPGDGSAPQTAVSNATNTLTLHEKILDGAAHFIA